MNQQQLNMLPKPMQEAVQFCEYWNLANGLDEFLKVIGKEPNEENKLWASTRATMFRKNGVQLKNQRGRDEEDDYLDYSTLQVIARVSMAELTGKKDEAETIAQSIFNAQAEAKHIVAELRKFKDLAVVVEKLKQGAEF